MNGKLLLPIKTGKFFTVIGGAYKARPLEGTVNLKLAKEIKAPFDINIPIEDFCVPEKEDMDKGLESAVRAITKGQCLYVGCMAGRGRTGLFLAVLAKAFGIDKPVEYVRATYYSHAVETHEQFQYVSDYEIPKSVKRMLVWAKMRAYFSFKKSLTNTGTVLS